jgi:surfeit locus 1 family protein
MKRVAPSSARARLVVFIAAVVGATVTARLGVWQWSRAAEKSALQAAIEEKARAPALTAAQLARTPEQAAEQLHRRVEVRGRWLGAYTIYLDNRQMNGAPGFYVVTPLELSPGDAVLVQRGWAPRNAVDRTALPPVTTDHGVVEVRGRIAASPARLYEFSKERSGPIRQNLDIAEYARETGIALRPVSIQQFNADGKAGDGLVRQWPRPEFDVSKHHGYAFQWFALSALIAGLYVWFQFLGPWLGRTR